ncbi:DNA polymerase III epsilon subunit-like protein [Actinocorallia herbida]|uniref:DNA polymerase III epsilon subunit-like protein n=1 Tax=Actinocorallia herbida TaxID=58109 RepID=A0A3N1CMK7_9ACTN|nr:exonuclease domain-containing protein [Actinocorallia herbida]ROO82523.1 DNA polymerase III epsilon subunit-like protein [Actinocorallia herbida]ROO82664.1 DNA polymerase III epsilon subunit-like protein [Actinocorallia herbida]
MSWIAETMFGFDTETTSVDVETARIVQIAQVMADARNRTTTQDVQLINAGVDIPEGASAIHGITTERMRAEGLDPKKVLEHYADELSSAMAGGTPIVGMNLAYDFTLFDRELRRHGLRTLDARLGRAIGPVVDVYVLDKLCDPWRPTKNSGGRKLGAMAKHYGVRLDNAHDAGADALASCRIAWQMVTWGSKPVEFFLQFPHVQNSKKQTSDQAARDLHRNYQRLTEIDLVQLHQAQIKAKRKQDAELRDHFAKQGKPCDADGLWPMRPYKPAAVKA